MDFSISSFVRFLLFIVSGIFELSILKSVTFVYIALLTVYAALLLTKPEKELELKKNKKVLIKKRTLLWVRFFYMKIIQKVRVDVFEYRYLIILP